MSARHIITIALGALLLASASSAATGAPDQLRGIGSVRGAAHDATAKNLVSTIHRQARTYRAAGARYPQTAVLVRRLRTDIPAISVAAKARPGTASTQRIGVVQVWTDGRQRLTITTRSQSGAVFYVVESARGVRSNIR